MCTTTQRLPPNYSLQFTCNKQVKHGNAFSKLPSQILLYYVSANIFAYAFEVQKQSTKGGKVAAW